MNRKIVVIGGSAGGISALKKIMPVLPENLPAAIFIVQHTHPQSPGMLDRILRSAGDIQVSYAIDGEQIQMSRVYVAPADHHLLVERDHVRVVRGPKENRHRPAIDPLFRSAAASYGPEVIGVILSGYLDDGSSGLVAVKSCGGMAIVQEPSGAEVPDMPANALKHVEADYTVGLDSMGELLTQMVQTPVNSDLPMSTPESVRLEAGIPAFRNQDSETVDKLGKRSKITCPECHGLLWEMHDGSITRFRCHVGHAFTGKALSMMHEEAVEQALWIALRSLEESATLALTLSARAEQRGDTLEQSLFQDRMKKATLHASTLREILSKQ